MNIQTSKERVIKPDKFRSLTLNIQEISIVLNTAPLEKNVEPKNSSVIVSLPLPTGEYGRFRIVESPIMEKELADKYPEIKTYAGQGIDDPYASVRFDLTPHGFHAMIFTVSEVIFIDPYAKGDNFYYISYFKKDFKKENADFICYVNNIGKEIPTLGDEILAEGQLRTYRVAIATTGEYTAYHGGTVTLGLAAVVTSLNRVDGVYEKEVSVRMVLIANNNLIIYTNSSTDPYTNNNGSTMLGQNITNLNSVIGPANYDIGHVFSTGGGGVAYLGSVCGSSKAGGVTGSPAPIGDPFDIDYVAHEMGHQFGGNHTFNGTLGSCSGSNRNASTAYEPGSGTTIMAYAGICGTDNTQSNSDAYFHTISIDEINTFTSGTGNSCAVVTSTGNHNPIVTVPTSGFYIPKSTPFSLTGSATDADSDPLTYCWEEFDLGAAGAPNSPVGTAPIFRSFSPVSTGTRIFPKVSDLLNNTQTLGELLPTYDRVLTFRLIARDNKTGGGGTGKNTITFNVSASAGPFLVTSPNTAVSWDASVSQTVTWNVANTTASPISCANVNILLSTDGGYTYPTTLKSNTPNDGTESVTLPSINTSTARIKVEAVGNIFFDISNTNFSISYSGTPMTYSSGTTTQTNNSYVYRGTQNNQVIGVQIVTIGSASPMSATSFTFNTTGTDNPLTNISNANLWYTGTTNTFSTSLQFGSLVASPNGVFSFIGTQALSEGTNYFWLTYDVNSGATENNVIDASCTGFNVGGSRTPTVTDPAGNRQIVERYAALPYSQNFEGTWISQNGTRDLPDYHWLNSASTGDNSWRRQDDGSSASWTNSSSGIVSPSGSSYAADFHSSEATNGSIGNFYIYLNMSQVGSKRLTFNYQNSTGTDNLKIFLSVDGGSTFGTELLSLTSPHTWSLQTVELGASTSSTCVLRFSATSDNGTDDIGIDNVSVQLVDPRPSTATVIHPVNGVDSVYKQTLKLQWNAPSSGNTPEGYKVYFGTNTPPTTLVQTIIGGSNTSYTPTVNYNTVYYWKIVPYITAYGDALNCPEWTFKTQPDQNYGNDGGYLFANSIADIGNKPTYNWITEESNHLTSPMTMGDFNDGYQTVDFPTGYRFRFFGVDYSNVNINTNGMVTFGTGSFDHSNVQIPSSNEPNNFIAGAWCNLDVPQTGLNGSKIYYGGNTTRFVITYWHVTNSLTTSLLGLQDDITFQIILYLHQNGVSNPSDLLTIQYNYAESTKPVLSNSISKSCTAGIEGQSAKGITTGVNYRYSTDLNNILGGPMFESESSPGLAVSFSTNAPLSVSLTSFNYKLNKNNVNLNWGTSCEINNYGFEIERKSESGNWEKVGFIEGKGNTTSSTSYKYSDKVPNPGKYNYRLKQIDIGGNFEYHNMNGIVDIAMPKKYQLSQNYPNPFNPTTKIDFDLPADGKVSIKVYDITGREVKSLVNEYRTAGYYTVSFDASGLASGLYLYQIQTQDNKYVMTKKMVVLK